MYIRVLNGFDSSVFNHSHHRLLGPYSGPWVLNWVIFHVTILKRPKPLATNILIKNIKNINKIKINKIQLSKYLH